MLLAYLIEPGRAGYELDDLAAEYGVEPIPTPAADDETAALVRHAEIPRRLAPIMLDRVRERGAEQLYREIELPLTAVLAAMEDAGVKIDTYRMGEITARLADRLEELEAKAYELAGEEFMIGSTQQVARILFEKLQLTPGRKGKTGLLHRHARVADDPPRARDRRGDRGVARVLEAAEHVSPAAAEPDLGRGRPSAHALQPDSCVDGPPFDVEPEPAGDSDPHGAREGDSARRLSLRRARGCCRRTTPRSSCGSSRTSRASRSCGRHSRAATTSTRRRR